MNLFQNLIPLKINEMKPLHVLCLLLVLISCKETKTQLTKITAKTIAIDSLIEPNTEIEAVIAPFQKKLSAEMNQVLTYTPKDLVKKDGEMQSSLGNLMADLCMEQANPIYKEKTNQSIDFAMFNHGGIRASIFEGNVITEHAFNVMPFENELVVAKISGTKMLDLIDYFLEAKRAHPLSKNIAFTIEENKYDLKINGKPFDKSKSYNVLTSDYLQNGGSNMVFFKNPEKLTVLNYKMRNAIIDYLKKVDTLKTALDNRVIVK